MSGAVELLACPFCGSEAKMSVVLSADGAARGDQPSFDVECSRCWVWHRWDNETDAVAAWNTRAPDPSVAALQAEVARLRNGLAKIWADDYLRAGMDKGKCHHGLYAYEVCEECIWEFALSVLNPAPSEKEAG